MITLVVTARASYAKLYTVIEGLLAQPRPLEILCYGSAVLERYGDVARRIHQDWPALPVIRMHTTLEGATLATSAADTGYSLSLVAHHFEVTRPAAVVVCADRYETVAASLAAHYQHIPVAHLQGGERSGNIDDTVRALNTVLATYHFPATMAARQHVLELTGLHGTRQPAAHTVWTGCPSIDLALRARNDPPLTRDELGGDGAPVDPLGPFALVVQHPDTERPEAAYLDMTATLCGTQRANLPALVLWPGSDAGMELTSKAIRAYRNWHPEFSMHTLRNLPPARFLRLMTQATVMVGNSSAGIREASALGVPVVNVGHRQRGRECSPYVRHVPHDPEAIATAVRLSGIDERPPASNLYGDGHAGQDIARHLATWIP